MNRITAYAALAVVIGGLLATQTRVNGELATRIGDGYTAALISFVAGLLALVALAVLFPRVRSGVFSVGRATMGRSMPWWYLLGGTAGALVVLSQGLTAAVIGVALFTVAMVAGQTLGGLLIDRKGMGTMGPRPLTARRVVGSALALVAVVVAVASELQGDIPLWMIAMPFAAGIAVGWQQAVTGQVQQVAGSALAAALLNFAVGTLVLIVAFVVHGVATTWPSTLPDEAWLYVGGPLGVLVVAGIAAVVRVTGVLILGLGTVAGQLVASVLLDAFAPIEGSVLNATTVIGTLLALVAVGIALFPSKATRAAIARK